MEAFKIVCMGDSLTEGILVEPTATWPYLLGEILDVEVINSGISGDTTAGMLARFYQMAIAHEPTHIVIMGGTNDLYSNLENNLIISNILAMTKYARHNDIDFIIAIPPPLYNDEIAAAHGIFLAGNELEQGLIQFQEKLKAVMVGKEIPIIDFSINMPADRFLEDGVHTNEKGHAQMAKVAAKVLRDVFKNDK